MTTDRRCPACSSLVRPDAGWCSLCHADLRTDEERAAARPEPEWTEPVLDQERSDEPPGPDPAGELAVAAAPAPRGRHARPGAAVANPAAALAAGGPSALSGPALSSAAASDADAALAKAGVDVQSMLSLLAAGEPDPLAPITGRLSSKGSRAVAAVVATVALISLGILAMFVLGSFVH